MQLSSHFTFDEFVYSSTALRRGIQNMPGPRDIVRMRLLCEKVLEPVRDLVGRPVRITSGYRCAELNSVIGGSGMSQHTSGEAADFVVEGMIVPDVFWLILKSPIVYDQLINEFGAWIHISFSPMSSRRESLAAMKDAENETEYTHITA